MLPELPMPSLPAAYPSPRRPSLSERFKLRFSAPVDFEARDETLIVFIDLLSNRLQLFFLLV